MNLEIETKLSAPDDLVLPMLDLTAAGLRTAEKPTKLTVTTYFDTESFDLFSCGAALRFRRSSQASRDEAGIWTLKFAPPAKGYVSSRFEFELEASGVQVPLKFIPALAVFGAAEPFNKLASLAAARRAIIFETEAGLPVIELDDDFVEIVEGPNQGLRFREIEVEQMVQGFAKQAEEIALHVLSAGASYAKSSSKLEQALENAKNQGFFSKLLDRYPHLVISDLSVLAGLVLEDP
ncbi:MAG: CYTH domain-containing protein, partial [Actinomycetota bacterium]